jgi:hypothetical protein
MKILVIELKGVYICENYRIFKKNLAICVFGYLYCIYYFISSREEE